MHNCQLKVRVDVLQYSMALISEYARLPPANELF